MDVLKPIGTILKVRDELYDLRKKVEHHEKVLDNAVSELIECLKHRKIIEEKVE
jgi:cell division protein FtsL